jgi:hypothetical protein
VRTIRSAFPARHESVFRHGSCSLGAAADVTRRGSGQVPEAGGPDGGAAVTAAKMTVQEKLDKTDERLAELSDKIDSFRGSSERRFTKINDDHVEMVAAIRNFNK